MFDGFEVDVLSLGDADCILVSEWAGYGVTRLLIDGGRSSDYGEIKAFLKHRNATTLDFILCSHLHNDHAAGLIKLVGDRSFTVRSGFMHDIRNHVDSAKLRGASGSSSSDADGIREVIENTRQLHSNFLSRGITPIEPFAGVRPAILGPSKAYYANVIAEFTKGGAPTIARSQPAFGQGGMLAALAGVKAQTSTIPFTAPIEPTNTALSSVLSRMAQGNTFLAGSLSKSAIKNNPSTQPFNNTSVIVGLNFKGYKFLFTADAGCDALRQVAPGWGQLYCLQVPHHGSEGNLSKDLVVRFHPQLAFISACGDDCHPSPAVKNALITAGTRVFSTHYPHPGHLRIWLGNVPDPGGYGEAIPMKGAGVAIAR